MGKKRDWKKSADYEDLRKLTTCQWAWEFLRRNPNYIKEWKKELPLEIERINKLLSDPETKDAPYLEGYRKNTPESCHFNIPGQSLSKYFKKWGILNLVNPEQDTPYPNPFLQFSSFEYGTVRGGGIGWGKYVQENFPCGRYAPMVFDLTRPLKPQFINAQRFLLEYQSEQINEGKIHVTMVKKHKDNWIEYLRILDAKAENVSNEEIARVMFPNLKNEYPGYAGNEKVRKSFNTAKRLSQKGYCNIAMTF